VHEGVHCLMCASATYLDEQACLSMCQVFKINAVAKISCTQYNIGVCLILLKIVIYK
jgi:predicted nucleic acid-binding Zn ribbon protein